MILKDEEQNQNDDDVELVPEFLVEELIPEEPEQNPTKNKVRLLIF